MEVPPWVFSNTDCGVQVDSSAVGVSAVQTAKLPVYERVALSFTAMMRMTGMLELRYGFKGDLTVAYAADDKPIKVNIEAAPDS